MLGKFSSQVGKSQQTHTHTYTHNDSAASDWMSTNENTKKDVTYINLKM